MTYNAHPSHLGLLGLLTPFKYFFSRKPFSFLKCINYNRTKIIYYNRTKSMKEWLLLNARKSQKNVFKKRQNTTEFFMATTQLLKVIDWTRLYYRDEVVAFSFWNQKVYIICLPDARRPYLNCTKNRVRKNFEERADACTYALNELSSSHNTMLKLHKRKNCNAYLPWIISFRLCYITDKHWEKKFLSFSATHLNYFKLSSLSIFFFFYNVIIFFFPYQVSWENFL